MEKTAVIRDTIPRLQQLVPHMRDQLIGLRDGATFEQARLRYSTTVDRLFTQGLGRRTASRVGDEDRYWAPTGEVLDEAMRLGFVNRQPLPSARKYLNAYRDRRYGLTDLGEQVADQAEKNIAAFSDELATAVYNAHPYFRGLIHILQESPLTCPEVTEGHVEESRRSGRHTAYWIDYAMEQLMQGLGGLSTSPQESVIRETIVSAVRRRFGQARTQKPTSKEMSETFNDAFAEAAIKHRGLSIGAINLNMLKSWGSQLRLLDQSRYVPSFEKQNVIWLAADLRGNDDFPIQRRTLDKWEWKVAEAIVAAYRSQALAAGSSLRAPYLPIYRVRADAAHHCEVTRSLVDLVIERLTAGEIPDLGIEIWLHLGTTKQPASEPVYRRGGNRRYEMTLSPNTV